MEGPRPSGLGRLSARYESARAGASAIGWDSAGGTSYGTYQIATLTGTMNNFISWCQSRFPLVYNALLPFSGSQGDRHGPFALKWEELAAAGKVQAAEHEFIAETHYDPAFGKCTDTIRTVIVASRALQDVLWSTAVQHGPNGAAYVFNSAWSDGTSTASYITRIYERRSRRLGNLTPEVRQAVLARYAAEQMDAHQIARSQS